MDVLLRTLGSLMVSMVNCRCVQVCVWAMEEETIRCDEVCAEGEVLGVQTAALDCPSRQAYSSRQGPSFGLQGQAGN